MTNTNHEPDRENSTDERIRIGRFLYVVDITAIVVWAWMAALSSDPAASVYQEPFTAVAASELFAILVTIAGVAALAYTPKAWADEHTPGVVGGD